MPRLTALRCLLPLAMAGLAACGDQASVAPPNSFGGDPRRGARLIAANGCGACHIIPNIRGARGMVGPPLTHMARRAVVAGMLSNTPENLMTWIKNPQRVVPGNAMPNMGLKDEDTRDIAAYLYTLR